MTRSTDNQPSIYIVGPRNAAVNYSMKLRQAGRVFYLPWWLPKSSVEKECDSDIVNRVKIAAIRCGEIHIVLGESPEEVQEDLARLFFELGLVRGSVNKPLRLIDDLLAANMDPSLTWLLTDLFLA